MNKPFKNTYNKLDTVSDRFAGYFDSCSKDDTRSDMLKIDDIKSSKLRCARSCGESKDCMGFNFQSAVHRFVRRKYLRFSFL